MTTVPEWVEPIPERVNLPALKVALPHQYGERIPEHDRIKWSEFLESAQKRILEVPDSKPSTWDLATLAEFANNRRVETTDVSPGVSSIMRKMTKTMRTVEVVPKKKKRQLATANDIVNTLVSGGNEEEVQMEEDIHLEVQEEIGVHVEEVEEFDITIDSIVAFYDERESARPCLGHVVEVKTEDDITWMNLHLLQGGYKKAFKLAQNGVGKNRKPVMQWFDVKAAICWNIVLTKANRLSPQMVKYLQALYSELEDGHSSD
ncbi:uncharacterized protein [Amphiura filiformis]|uniref:uncharacterized protein n=1 Tax=Amphiura filiformis TaxID=82378 RepID=UPI003B21C8F0